MDFFQYSLLLTYFTLCAGISENVTSRPEHYLTATGGTTEELITEEGTETTITTQEYESTTVIDEDGISKAVSYPCKCAEGACSCCTGNLLQNLNFNMKQKLCTNLTFDPEDFTLGVKIAFNSRVLYSQRISGRNPPPICLPIPRLSAMRVCLRFSHVYFVGRNVHACVAFEGQWNKEAAFTYNFDCMRLGTDGIALVKPEDGGGLPFSSSTPSVDDIEEYDENVITV